jgi:hypothetical protein
MEVWCSKIREIQKVSLNQWFLDARISAVGEARKMLYDKCGQFTKYDFNVFFDLSNMEVTPIDPDLYDLHSYAVSTRFRPSFMGNNRNNLLKTPDECNRWMASIWLSNADTLNILDQFWKEGRVKGAGTSFPTLIMYLKDPERYNVWIPGLAKTLSILLGRKFKMTRNSRNYLDFNDGVNKAFRQPFKLLPQEIDYILFRIGVNLK